MPYTKPPLESLLDALSRLVEDCANEQMLQASKKSSFIDGVKRTLFTKQDHDSFDRHLLQAVAVAVQQETFPGDQENKQFCLLGASFYLRRKNFFTTTPLLKVLTRYLSIDDSNTLDAKSEYECLLRFKACLVWMSNESTGFMAAFQSSNDALASRYADELDSQLEPLREGIDGQLQTLQKTLTPVYTKPDLGALLDASHVLEIQCLEEQKRRMLPRHGFFGKVTGLLSQDSFDVADAQLLRAVAVAVASDVFPYQSNHHRLGCLLGVYFYLLRKNQTVLCSNPLFVLLKKNLAIDENNLLDPQTEHDSLLLFTVCLKWMGYQHSPFKQILIEKDELLAEHFFNKIALESSLEAINDGTNGHVESLRQELDKSSDPGGLSLLKARFG